jgi:hypothetical protein
LQLEDREFVHSVWTCKKPLYMLNINSVNNNKNRSLSQETALLDSVRFSDDNHTLQDSHYQRT